MNQFPIHWSLIQEDISSGPGNSYFWSHALNAEWTLKCVCKQNNPFIPDLIEIQRKSLVGEFLIWGLFELRKEGQIRFLFKKRFVFLFDNCCYSTCLDLKSIDNYADLIIMGKLTTRPYKEDVYDLTYLLTLTESQYFTLKELSNDFESLAFEKSFLSDVYLKSGSTSIPGHKIILSVRSPVFRDMFKNNSKKVEGNQVIIKDIKPPVLRAMLRYMYTGKINDMTVSFALDLLFAANKYQLASLESECGNFVMSSISTKNVTKILMLGDLFSPFMKEAALDFICNKFSVHAIEESEDWGTLKNDRLALALEIMTSIAKFREDNLIRIEFNLKLFVLIIIFLFIIYVYMFYFI